MTVIHLDNCLTIGNLSAIKDAIRLIQEIDLELKIKTHVTDYLGCKLIINPKKDQNLDWTASFGQKVKSDILTLFYKTNNA